MIKEELKKFPPGCIGGELELRKDGSKFLVYYFEEERWVSRRSLFFILKRRNITFKEWHDYHYLPRDENEDIIYPKCKYCGEDAIWIDHKYRFYCENCHSSYVSEIQRERMKMVVARDGNRKNDLESFIKRHGEELGTIKYNEFRSKISRSRTLEGMIENHGEEEGTKLHEKMCSDIRYHRSRKGYLEIYGEDEGEKRYEEYQNKRRYSMSLDGLIEKYGEDEGLYRYNRYHSLRKSFSSLNGLIARYGKDIGTKKFLNIQESLRKGKEGTDIISSKISRILFRAILDRIQIMFSDLSKDVFYGENEKRILTGKFVGDISLSRVPDFLIKSMNIIIEFQGDYWHPRPSSPEFSLDDLDDRMERSIYNDYCKLRSYRKLGYYVFYVHEREFRDNPDLIIEECIKFITNEDFRNEYTRLMDEILV